MRALLALVGILVLAPSTAVTQEGKAGKERAPAGCISCEQMCDWCIGLGKQPKAEREKCHGSCRAWGSMVGIGTVYVHKHGHLCGTKSYAPRCN